MHGTRTHVVIFWKYCMHLCRPMIGIICPSIGRVDMDGFVLQDYVRTHSNTENSPPPLTVVSSRSGQRLAYICSQLDETTICFPCFFHEMPTYFFLCHLLGLY